MAFKDHFSSQAATYAQARPGYPDALYTWLAQQCRRRELAWDAGAGSGQCAVALARHFQRVVATEPSAAQVANAVAHPRVEYRIEAAEEPSFEPGTVDLLCVAQALHWFDLERFWPAARRVLRGDAMVAVWSYQLSSVDAAVDRVYMHLYDEVLGAYWPPERSHIIDAYARLPFPFVQLPAPPFEMQREWTLGQYLDYLRSWSASARYRAERGEDPVDGIADAMAAAWGDPLHRRTVTWPLQLRVGRVAA